MFIFNTELLLIGVRSFPHLLMTIAAAVAAMLVFAAATQGWFLTRSRWYESMIMLLVTFTLLRPDFWMDFLYPKYDVQPMQRLAELASATPAGSGLRMRIEGATIEGKEVKKTVLLPLGDPGPVAQRLSRSGLATMTLPTGIQVAAVNLHSPADRAGFEQGFTITGIETPAERPAKEWFFLPALAVLGMVVLMQRRRAATLSPAAAVAQQA
jgi:hypothetical protein